MVGVADGLQTPGMTPHLRGGASDTQDSSHSEGQSRVSLERRQLVERLLAERQVPRQASTKLLPSFYQQSMCRG